MSVGASLKSIPARSLLSASFSFLSLAVVILVPLSSPSLSRHGREGGGTEVGVAPSYVSDLACEAKDEALVGNQDEETRESAGEKKHEEDETWGSEGGGWHDKRKGCVCDVRYAVHAIKSGGWRFHGQ